jgi:integrase
MQHERTSRVVREKVERGIYRRRTKGGELRYEFAYVDSDGKQRWETVRTLKEARDGRAKIRSRILGGERVAPTRMTFGEYADRWLEQQTRLRASTHSLYSTYLRVHLKPRFGRRPMQSITVDDVAGLIAEMEKGIRYELVEGRTTAVEGKPLAANSIRGVLLVLGRVFGAATRAGLVPANPVRRLEKEERPKVERRLFPSLDPEAIGTLIASTPKRYRTLVAVSVLTGVRQSEALGLRWQDVDVKAGVLRVRHQLGRDAKLAEPKTKAAKRDVPFAPSLGKMLAAHKELAFARGLAKPTDYVFASEEGGPLHYRNVVRRGLEKALAAGGLPALRWHDLRHLAASALIAQGVSVAYLSRVLGHASAAITLSIYAHEFARAEHDDRTREMMEAVYGEVLR